MTTEWRPASGSGFRIDPDLLLLAQGAEAAWERYQQLDADELASELLHERWGWVESDPPAIEGGARYQGYARRLLSEWGAPAIPRTITHADVIAEWMRQRGDGERLPPLPQSKDLDIICDLHSPRAPVVASVPMVFTPGRRWELDAVPNFWLIGDRPAPLAPGEYFADLTENADIEADGLTPSARFDIALSTMDEDEHESRYFVWDRYAIERAGANARGQFRIACRECASDRRVTQVRANPDLFAAVLERLANAGVFQVTRRALRARLAQGRR